MYIPVCNEVLHRSILYEDKDFNNKLGTLVNMVDFVSFESIRIVEIESVGISTPMTETTPVSESESNSYMRRASGSWSIQFSIPTFDHDIEEIMNFKKVVNCWYCPSLQRDPCYIN